MGFDNCFTAFIALLFGLGLGLVLFTIEVWSKRIGFKLPSYESDPRSEAELVAEDIHFLKTQNKDMAKELMECHATIKLLRKQLNEKGQNQENDIFWKRVPYK